MYWNHNESFMHLKFDKKEGCKIIHSHNSKGVNAFRGGEGEELNVWFEIWKGLSYMRLIPGFKHTHIIS